jgi:hypothetical protein
MKKPGEKAMTPLKRSPLSNASEIAYEAPSENPPMTNRVALIASISQHFKYQVSFEDSGRLANCLGF